MVLYKDLEELCRYYRVALTQPVPYILLMWIGFCIMCTCHGWTYSLPLFWCFYRLVVVANNYHYFQHTFTEWYSERWNWDTDLHIVDDFHSSTSNYKKLYLFYQGGVSCVIQPFQDVASNFGKLSVNRRNAIDILFCRHQRPDFKPFYSTEDTPECNFLLNDI